VKTKAPFKRQYFGTDGIRGKVGSATINPYFMLRLAFGIGKVLLKNDLNKVLIGRDTRSSGYMLESALQSGLNATGINVRLLGEIPTPALAYLTKSLSAAAGIVISASHNPYDDNGIKLFNEKGLKLSDEIEAAIELEIPHAPVCVDAKKLGISKPIIDAIPRYIEFCKNTFPVDLSLKNLKIVLDCANGAGWYVAPSILRELDAHVIPIFDKPNGININDHCGATHTKALQEAVIKHKADVGIALDGDGDRLILIDHKGHVLDGDEILAILANDYLMRNPNQTFGVVGTIMTNLALEELFNNMGIGFRRTQVGDRYVLGALLKNNWPLGGETSGHIICFNNTSTGDAIIASLQTLAAMLYANKSLFELKKILKKYPQLVVNVPVENKNIIQNNPTLERLMIEIKKNLNGKGRLILRPSGTEPVIRVMLEGEDSEKIKHFAEQITECIRQ
jgi:phosphoglucosamine mutase